MPSLLETYIYDIKFELILTIKKNIGFSKFLLNGKRVKNTNVSDIVGQA